MRVVVTGATGNVGSAVLDRLGRCDDVTEIVGVARRLPAITLPKVRWRSLDVGHDDLVEVLTGADAVVHLAWRFQPTRDERETWHANVVGSMRTFEAALAAGVRALVYASSIGAYSPGPHMAELPDELVDETWPTHALPTAAYGRQKSYLERVLDAVDARGVIRMVRIRSAFVFQRRAAPEQRRIFAGRLVPGRLVGALPVVPLPRGFRMQAVAASDLAAAYEAALTRPVAGAFNIAATPVLRAAELGHVLGARPIEVSPAVARRAMALAFKARVIRAEPGLLELAQSLPMMDTSKARRELEWCPHLSSIDAMRELVHGLLDPEGGPTPPLAAGADT